MVQQEFDSFPTINATPDARKIARQKANDALKPPGIARRFTDSIRALLGSKESESFEGEHPNATVRVIYRDGSTEDAEIPYDVNDPPTRFTI